MFQMGGESSKRAIQARAEEEEKVSAAEVRIRTAECRRGATGSLCTAINSQ